MQTQATIDLNAYRENLSKVFEMVGGADMMAVVKANAYGHGMLPMARAARSASIPWLGVATVAEAMALRAAGDTGRIFLMVGGDDLTDAIAADIDLPVSNLEHLNAVTAAGKNARIHLKIDTGLSRNGSTSEDWPELLEAAKKAPVRIEGVWSHFASADNPSDPVNELQEQRFNAALEVAAALGIEVPIRHLANSAGALLRPQARFDLVRIGMAGYGLSPAFNVDPTFGLRPVMTLRSTLINVKTIPAGAGVSYGHRFVAEKPTKIGLVPVGYGDGIARSSTGATIFVGGQRAPIIGAVCMDQFLINLDGIDAKIGDEVILFGPGADGEPTANDWAETCGTINYEVITRLGGRIHRAYLGDE